MAAQNVLFKREFEMPIFYRKEQIGTRRVDFLVEDIISVELKAITVLEDVHFAQAINYLEAYNMKIGLLINFGNQSLQTLIGSGVALVIQFVELECLREIGDVGFSGRHAGIVGTV